MGKGSQQDKDWIGLEAGEKNEDLKCKESRNSGVQFKSNAAQRLCEHSLNHAVVNNGLIPGSGIAFEL